MAYSGVIDWVNGIHGKDDLEGETCNACATNTLEMILIEAEKRVVRGTPPQKTTEAKELKRSKVLL